VAQRREELRAADVDRAFVEYDERLRDVYAAKTYGDLDKLLFDLPGFHPVGGSQVMPATAHQVAAPPQAEQQQQRLRYPTDEIRQEMQDKPLSSMPRWLVGIWSAWLVAVSVNVVIWALVSVSTEQFVYFWPMWVAGPWGAVLLATTLSGIARGDHQREIERRAERRARDRHQRRQGRYGH
jgi:hypothetical protein